MSNQHDFILLDRSGSMSDKWEETLSSINAYVKELADENVETAVTLAMFDGHQQRCDFEVIRNKVAPKNWQDLTKKDATPRGWTPLNDAIGEVVGLANTGAYDKVAIIIMTDGHENASQELTVEQAKQLLEDCRQKGWQVIFLGANYDNVVQAANYGNAQDATVQVSTANLGMAMRATAQSRRLYGSGATQSMSYSSEQQVAWKSDSKTSNSSNS